MIHCKNCNTDDYLIDLSFAYAAEGGEPEEIKAEEEKSEEQQNIFERGKEAEENKSEQRRQEESIANEKGKENKEKGKRHHERDESNSAQGGNYTVLGRLSVPGTKRKYTITADELKRRITAENMSNNMLRSLIRVCTFI